MKPLKRLVICCDGTWKSSDDKYVSNIERLARSVDTSPERTDGRDVVQIVHYSSGVGTGATKSDKFLGGLLGLGLDASILTAYRFLALNYEPGDEIFVFGFSRGAFTARSLVGMIDAVGLLKPEGVVAGGLPTAMKHYRSRPKDGQPTLAMTKFRHDYCFPEDDVPIEFLGVFDTVGALGIPGMPPSKYDFHSIELSDIVVTARHALAIDERRLAFVPSVWNTAERKVPSTHSVRQVWFEGVHSDVGGGYKDDEAALAAVTLNWMRNEAEQQGLVFCPNFLLHEMSTDPPVLHDSLTRLYKLANVLSFTRIALRIGRPDDRHAESGRRVLGLDESEYIAEPAYRRWQDNVCDRQATAANVGNFDRGGRSLTSVEPMPPLPTPSQELPSVVMALRQA